MHEARQGGPEKEDRQEKEKVIISFRRADNRPPKFLCKKLSVRLGNHHN